MQHPAWLDLAAECSLSKAWYAALAGRCRRAQIWLELWGVRMYAACVSCFGQ